MLPATVNTRGPGKFVWICPIPGRCSTVLRYVRNRRLRRAASRLRCRGRCAAPDGVPRLRLGGCRAGQRPRHSDGAPPRRSAGQSGSRAGRHRPGSAERALRTGPHPVGHPRPAHRPQRPPASRRRRQDRGRAQRDHRELRRAAPRAGSRGRGVRQRHRHRGRRAPGRPAVRTTARPPATSPPPCWPCCAASRAISRWCSPTPTSRARSSPPAAPRRWCSASATARCSSAPMWRRSSNTPATPSNSARTRPW